MKLLSEVREQLTNNTIAKKITKSEHTVESYANGRIKKPSKEFGEHLVSVGKSLVKLGKEILKKV